MIVMWVKTGHSEMNAAARVTANRVRIVRSDANAALRTTVDRVKIGHSEVSAALRKTADRVKIDQSEVTAALRKIADRVKIDQSEVTAALRTTADRVRIDLAAEQVSVCLAKAAPFVLIAVLQPNDDRGKTARMNANLAKIDHSTGNTTVRISGLRLESEPIHQKIVHVHHGVGASRHVGVDGIVNKKRAV